MNQIESFQKEVEQSIDAACADEEFIGISRAWFEKSVTHRYPYNFTWMGIPIIQYPQDIIAMQELVFMTKPDLIIETGVAHGGSLVFYASMLELLGEGGRVAGIDIDIRKHNRERLERHPMYSRITLIEGSSIGEETVNTAYKLAEGCRNPLVILDSLHTHEHVSAELMAYSPLIGIGGYIVVFDTIIEEMPGYFYADRPWAVGNNPKTAVEEFIADSDSFIVDDSFDRKLLLTTCPGGILRRVK